MSSNFEILIAGFGGQGILFSGKCLVYTGMLAGKQVTWLPSYGPEMRGGTANCSVIISDQPIGSPIVNHPTVMVSMNLPSFEKYDSATVPGGKSFVDSSLIRKKSTRTDVDTYYIPATQMAEDLGLKGLANMIMVGKIIRETGLCTLDEIGIALKKMIPEKRAHLLDANLKAIRAGYDYQ